MRLKLTTGELIALIALLLNAGAIVWGAATLASAVRNIEKLVAKLENSQESLSKALNNLFARLRVVEYELKIFSDEV